MSDEIRKGMAVTVELIPGFVVYLYERFIQRCQIFKQTEDFSHRSFQGVQSKLISLANSAPCNLSRIFVESVKKITCVDPVVVHNVGVCFGERIVC